MRENEYSEAAVEVLDILDYTNQEDLKKVPQSFIKFLTQIANKNYKVNFNHNIPISGLNLRKQTKELLGFIYITWWCNEKERLNYKDIIYTNNLNVKNYDVTEIFKNRKNTTAQNVEETSIIKYKEENILRKLLKKILKIFINKNERG